ncbi:MAG: T9SS type A sorting domain-containing protein, partial [Crocinitomicaceae bacterium]|nr:T9SS type A sorting domain-containing protein [Crocinitomicaceae bacterium]
SGGTAADVGTFTISRSCVTPTPPPANDACANATSLPCGTSGLAGTTVNAVSETAPLGYSSPYGVWYSFIGDGQSTTISSIAVFDHEMTIMTGSSCGSYAIVSSQDNALSNGTETYTFNTIVGTQYYVYLAHYSTTSITTGTFTISRTCSAPAWTDAWVSMNTGSSNWCAGETRTISVTVTNTGSSTWTDATPDINIGVKWNADADYFVRTDAGGLAPGSTQTYNLTVTAPLTTGTNNLTFDIVNENNFWFADNTNGGGPGNVVYTSPAITIVSSPILNAGADQSVCESASITLIDTGSGSISLSWNNGITNGVAFNAPTSTTTYTVTGTNAAGCTATDQVVVTVKPLPVVNAGADQTICIGNSALLSGSITPSATPINLIDEAFEGGVFPPSGWSTSVTNASYTWGTTTGVTGMSGTSAQVLWNYSQNEKLRTPSVSLSNLSAASLTFDISMSYYWSVTVNNMDASVKVSTDGGSTWTSVWSEASLGAFTTFQTYPITVDLASYIGSNIIVSFEYVGNDAADLSLDNVKVIGTPILTYAWAPSATLSNAAIANPVATITSNETYTLTGTLYGCSSSDAVQVTVNNPTLATAPTNGDMVWRGATTTDWATLGNWWQYNGTGYAAASAAPTAAQNVIIPANQTCVVYQPNTNANAGSAKTLRIESGANLTMGNGTLTVAENWVNNGTFTPGSGTVAFTGTGNHSISGSSLAHNFNNVTMNKAGEVQLSVPIAMSGALTLTNGRLDIGNFNLDLPTNTINGGNANSYVKTSGTGTLSRDVAGIAVNFPVGRSAYNAATLTNAGTADKYSVRVIDNVTDIGTNADAGATTTMAVVNRTWMINEQVAGGSDVTLGLNWNGAPEHIGGFQAASAFIAHYMSGAGLWDNIGGAVATNTIETSGITSFSPFTISSDLNFAPLPVELMSFSSVCSDNDVAIKWSTASENNSMHFVVETSTDALNWEVLSVVQAAQFSTSILNYAITHEGAARNKNYYRLKQVDLDGAVEFFNVIYANCGNVAGEPVVFPNPSNGNFTIDFSGAGMKGDVQLSIMNTEGKEISNREVNLEEGVNTYQINNMELQPGIYYLKIVDTTGRSFIIKHSFI